MKRSPGVVGRCDWSTRSVVPLGRQGSRARIKFSLEAPKRLVVLFVRDSSSLEAQVVCRANGGVVCCSTCAAHCWLAKQQQLHGAECPLAP